MARAVGLHFGHDASVACCTEQGLVSFYSKERHSRVKHAMGLSTDEIVSVLGEAVDSVIGLTTTQGVPIFFDDRISISVRDSSQVEPARFFNNLSADHPYHSFFRWADRAKYQGVMIDHELFPWHRRHNREYFRSYDTIGAISSVGDLSHKDMALDVELSIDNRKFAARFYDHHFAHALYAAHQASFDTPAIIVTGDGGTGPSFSGGGLYFWTPGQGLAPITPLDGWLGSFYTAVSMLIGFDEASGPGKLMGLAPYGRPVYFDEKLVGTFFEVSCGHKLTFAQILSRWISDCGLPYTKFKKWDLGTCIPDEFAADVAASVQAIFEINIVRLIRACISVAERCDFQFRNIVLSGGTALNCPSNSNICSVTGVNVIAPPGVNDEGLSIGASIAAYFDKAGRYPRPPDNTGEAVFVGPVPDVREYERIAMANMWSRGSDDDDIARVVDLIVSGELVGVFAGRSELGPRALGGRSIIGSPTSIDVWRKINSVKGREQWRPLAPAVLADESYRYFSRGPAQSSYMLFNYRCDVKNLEAVTHFDHSSRVQHVTMDNRVLYDVLCALRARGFPPIVVNTSFNGPGRPIVETFQDALYEAQTIGIRHVITDCGFFSQQQKA